MPPHYTLALEFEARRQGGFHHLAQRAHIILRHPLPKLQLCKQQQGLLVHQFGHVLQGGRVDGGRQRGAEAENDAGVVLAATERHHNSAAHDNPPGQLLRQAVGVGLAHGQGQYDIGKLVHLPCKGNN